MTSTALLHTHTHTQSTANLVRASMSLGKPLMSEADFERCFPQSLEQIVDMHASFLKQYAGLYYRDIHLSTLFIELLTHTLVQLKPAYSNYMLTYVDMTATLRDLRLRNPQLEWLLRLVECSTSGITGIDGLLIAPVQRLPRFALLLESLTACLCKDSADAALLADRFAQVTRVKMYIYIYIYGVYVFIRT
jgi:hypothetical protein